MADFNLGTPGVEEVKKVGEKVSSGAKKAIAFAKRKAGEWKAGAPERAQRKLQKDLARDQKQDRDTERLLAKAKLAGARAQASKAGAVSALGTAGKATSGLSKALWVKPSEENIRKYYVPRKEKSDYLGTITEEQRHKYYDIAPSRNLTTPTMKKPTQDLSKLKTLLMERPSITMQESTEGEWQGAVYFNTGEGVVRGQNVRLTRDGSSYVFVGDNPETNERLELSVGFTAPTPGRTYRPSKLRR